MRGNVAGWDSFEVLAALGLGAALVVAFVLWELRARQPMLPMRFFRSRAFSAGNAAIFFTFASLFGAVFFFAQLLQTGLGYGPLDAGLRLMAWTITFITIAPIAGTLADRFGERPFLVAGLTLQAAGFLWIALIAEPGLGYAELIAPFLVAGVGVSMAIPSAQNSVVGSVADADLGKAAGANSMMRELGGVFGIAVLVAVFAGAGSFASPQAFTDGFAPAVAVGALLSLAGAVAALAVPGRRSGGRAGPGFGAAGTRRRGLGGARLGGDADAARQLLEALPAARPARARAGVLGERESRRDRRLHVDERDLELERVAGGSWDLHLSDLNRRGPLGPPSPSSRHEARQQRERVLHAPGLDPPPEAVAPGEAARGRVAVPERALEALPGGEGGGAFRCLVAVV